MINLMAQLPRLLPKAVEWADRQQREILATGIPLTPAEIVMAREVGVAQPDKIRVKVVVSLPLPEDPELSAAALQTGLLGPNMTGLTLFYGIFICKSVVGSRNLIAHECRHVQQYERYGSVAAFLQEYLFQIVTAAYFNAPFEQDARMAASKYI